MKHIAKLLVQEEDGETYQYIFKFADEAQARLAIKQAIAEIGNAPYKLTYTRGKHTEVYQNAQPDHEPTEH